MRVEGYPPARWRSPHADEAGRPDGLRRPRDLARRDVGDEVLARGDGGLHADRGRRGEGVRGDPSALGQDPPPLPARPRPLRALGNRLLRTRRGQSPSWPLRPRPLPPARRMPSDTVRTVERAMDGGTWTI